MSNSMAAVIKDDLFDDYEENINGDSLQDSLDLPGSGKVVRSVVTPKKPAQANNLVMSVSVRDIVTKFQQIGTELKNVILERDDLIDDMLRALVVRDHILILGPPGTGKTMLARYFCQHIDGANFFYWLMNRTTDPSAILGPYDIKKMEKGHFTRVTTGMLPEAHIALLDEIGKSNEPAINIQLSILNERVFHDDGQPVPVPLRMMIGASNEDLDGDELSAIRDRLLYRHTVGYLKDPSNRIKLRELGLQRRHNNGSYQAKTLVTLDELETLEKFVYTVDVPKIIHEVLNKLLLDLENDMGLHISDRRDDNLIKILQAEATLQGRAAVSLSDIKILINVLAQQDKDIPKIKKIIDKAIDPWSDELNNQLERIAQIKKDLADISDPKDLKVALINSSKHVENTVKQIELIIDGMTNQGMNTKKAKTALTNTNKYHKELVIQMTGFDPSITSSMAATTRSSADIDKNLVDMPFD